MKNAVIEAAVGVPYREILRKARKEDIDLIIMGSHTHARRISAPPATAASLVAPCSGSPNPPAAPVVIISRPCTTCWKLFSNIVFGTDFSKAADYAYQWAYNLAKEVGAKLHLFHACDLNTSATGVVLDQSEIENQIAKAKEKIEKRYLSKMNGYDNYEMEVREGIPYVEILKFAREKTGDLIVMAHHTREIDPEKAVLGSTVEQVVLRSACPVAKCKSS